MKEKNGSIERIRDFKASVFEASQAKKRLNRENMRQKKEKFLYDSKLISFDDIMIFTYPKSHNKDNIFHLCIKDNLNMVEFCGKETKVPMGILQSMDINEVEVEFFSNTREDTIKFYSNNAKEIAESIDSNIPLYADTIDFLEKNFADQPLKMLSRKEIWDLDHHFVALQKGKHYGQNTFNDFEK